MLDESLFNLTNALYIGGAAVSLWIIRKTLSDRNLPPGPFAWPFVGNLLTLASRPKDVQKLYHELSQKYGPIFRLSMGSFNSIVVADLEIMKELNSNENFSDRPAWLFIIRTLKQNKGGVVMRNGDDWKRMRKIGLNMLRHFGMTKKDVEELILQEQDFLCDKFASHKEKAFCPKETITNAVSNIICRICFGHRFSYNDKEFLKYTEKLDEFSGSSAFANDPTNVFPILECFPMAKETQQMVDSLMEIDGWIAEKIAKAKDIFDPNNIRSMIDMYYLEETSKQLSSYEMQKLILEFFVAGTDTTANTILWGLLYLIENPEVQEKCHKEIDATIGKAPIYTSMRQQLPYLDATVHEIQRIASVAATGVVRNVRETTQLAGYTIPKNSIVFHNIYSVHMSKKHYKKPFEFNPENFLDENGQFRKNDAFMPFGMGPRICLGEHLAKAELFIYIGSLLQKFYFSKERDDITLNFQGDLGITHMPKHFNIVAKQR